MTAMTDAERAAKYRDRLKLRGLRPKTAVLSAQAVKNLAKIVRAKGCTESEAIELGLAAVATTITSTAKLLKG